jgi:hypothetical protein
MAIDTFTFGSGNIWTTQLTDINGNAIALPSPILIGTLQDASVDFSSDIKPLHGANKFAIAMGQGKTKITGKMKFARLDGAIFQQLVSGQSIATGTAGIYYDTTGSTVAATLTPTVPSSGTWVRNLCVRDGTGLAYTQVASAPATGQYSVTAGVYTFNASDVGKTVYIDFAYTATSTVNKTVLVKNSAMGLAPTFRVDFLNPKAGSTLTLFAALISKFNFATKLDDWAIHEIDFEAFTDSLTNNVYQWGLAA